MYFYRETLSYWSYAVQRSFCLSHPQKSFNQIDVFPPATFSHVSASSTQTKNAFHFSSKPWTSPRRDDERPVLLVTRDRQLSITELFLSVFHKLENLPRHMPHLFTCHFSTQHHHHQRTSSSCRWHAKTSLFGLVPFPLGGDGEHKGGWAESEPSSVCAQLDMCINKGIYYAGWHTHTHNWPVNPSRGGWGFRWECYFYRWW